ncbi:MAG: UDP-4-amino-4,6-dideoxy-N-acetyl-beta-L-altrosamine transaminase [Proteobacteria bacterium]|nr:UDP-4-amino-4,6-dideoxy-N-acetyl-beta-L-altrosamine transaminase [Pseudomonadota bacterium]
MQFLPYGRQSIDESDIEAVVAVLRSDFLTQGPGVDRFENALAQHAGARHAIAVNSGTAALHAAYFAAGLGPGDEIITSPLTFVATANAARYLGASVRLVDVEPDTGNLDPRLVATAITPQTRLIVPVDYAGHPADYDAINALAGQHGLTVVADAAHSLGASVGGRAVGTLAQLTEVSFHPVKPLTTGEGGAVLTDDPALAARAARFRTHGITKDPAHLRCNEGPWYYEMQDLGLNYRLTDLQCALGFSQLGRLDAFIARRRAIAHRYSEAFSAIDALQVPVVRPHVEPGWHLYVLRVRDASRRRAFFERLRDLGLGVQVHYIPVHYQPYYEQLGFRRGQYPVAEDWYARAVSIPIYPTMSDGDVESVIERVRQAVREIL